MRIHHRSSAAVAALTCVALGVTAATAWAGAPVGETIVEDARDRAVADGTRLIYMTTGGVVRQLDLAVAGMPIGRDLTQACAGTGQPGGVTAAGGGHALLSCAEPVPGADPAIAGARVLDLSNGRLVAPATPQLSYSPDRDRLSYVGIDAGRVCFSLTFDKGEARTGAVDWRTGAVAWGAECAGPRPGRGAPTFLPGDQSAYMPRCGVRLGWNVSASEIGGIVAADGVVFSRRVTTGGPVSFQFVPLQGICQRIAAGWRLTVAADGVRTRVSPRTGVGRDRATGAETRLFDLTRTGPTLALGGARRVTVRPAPGATRVRWKLGAGRWRAASRQGGAWVIEGVRAGARPRFVRLGVHFRDQTRRAGYTLTVRR